MPQVVLMGPPGAGKSSVAKALAKLLMLSYTDSDSAIESQTGKKISDIFVEDGEPAFRDIEARVVEQILNDEIGIVALGGGSILDPNTQENLAKSACPIIFLDVSISQAATRVGFNKDRPLLLINPRQQWLSLMEKRRPIYEKLATHTVSTDNKKPVEVAHEIADLLGLVT